MTRNEFLNINANALEQANRIMYCFGPTDIILVMSRDVLGMMTATTEFVTLNATDGSAEYRGLPIAVINEEGAQSFMRPALKGVVCHDDMMLDDLIIVDDENRLFRLVSKNPWRFVDTGFTVSYQILNNETRTMTDSATFNRVPVTFDPDINRAFADGLRISEVQSPDIYSGIDLLGHMSEVVCHGTITTSRITTPDNTYVRKRRKPKEQEEELDAGDTKLIDEFLNGFAHKESLQSGT